MPGKVYRLTVDGVLSDRMAAAFPECTLTSSDGTTTLTREIRDQSELQAMLSRLTDFGLSLLEVRVVDDLPAQRASTRKSKGDPETGIAQRQTQNG